METVMKLNTLQSSNGGKHKRWTRYGAAAAAVSVALALTACSTGTPTKASSATPAASAKLNSLLPANIRKAGTITIGSELDFPPFEYMKGSTLVGFDVDVADDLGKKLGVKMSFVNANFDGLVVGVQAGRYDVAMSALADTPDREQIVNFVNYGIASAGLLVQPGNPLKIRTLADMCGHSVAVQAGSVPAVPTTEAQSAKCVAAGKPAINIQTLQSGSDIYLALESKRVDIGFAGGPDAQYFLDQKPGSFDIVKTSIIDTGAFGIAVSKSNTKLSNALEAAMKAILADGSYAKIIDKWKLSTVAVTRTAINNTPSVTNN
jgi:polar amino acid transport system substrate-binding protein